ncbi:hypothetical protein MANES_17G027100v8 [Manihot esculenta]|uniref:Uncharacterized protein n=1 Tax=Manihot esculenta TaxID=3983 RepID=A0A2C9U434_MANES|nr:hypothetical protein MANES_17G027100v8 [Manihot esculenta]
MDSSRNVSSQPPLSPCSSGRRSSTSTSPEFEFWMVRNPFFLKPDLLSADELFVNGVLLPLHLLHLHNHCPCSDLADSPPPNLHPDAEPQVSPRAVEAEWLIPVTASKRWRDIFKKGDKKTSTSKNQQDKKKKKEKKSQGGASPAELNINIWPFSRSRSAGNSGGRARMFPGAPGSRKVNSAPCSRSNSAGESKLRKWPSTSSSPGRGGVHLGRSSPVWQVRRGSGGKNCGSEWVNRSSEKMKSKSKTTTGGGKVVNTEVPMCIGSNENSNVGSSGNHSNLSTFLQISKIYLNIFIIKLI